MLYCSVGESGAVRHAAWFVISLYLAQFSLFWPRVDYICMCMTQGSTIQFWSFFFSSFFSTPNMQSTIKIKALKLYGRYKQNELQNYFDSIFTESNDNHSHDTRHKSLRYQLPTKTSTGRLCVRHYIPEILTQTPECITEKLDIHSCSGFSNYMKNYHIQNYKANCLIENCYICQN